MLNWLVRYAPLLGLLRDRPGSILDVGSGPHGLACAAPDIPFAGLDVDFPQTVAPSMVAIRAPAGELPFRDAAFDTVLSLDTLEHVPAVERAGFVSELGRVAARRVLVACPTAEAAATDALLRDTFAAYGLPVPEWSREHEQHGLPEEADMRAWCAAVDGFGAAPLPMVNGLLSTLVVLADVMPSLAAEAAHEFRAGGSSWADLLQHACFGSSYRKAFRLERDEPVAAAVPAGCSEDGVLRALRRPARGRDGSGAWIAA